MTRPEFTTRWFPKKIILLILAALALVSFLLVANPSQETETKTKTLAENILELQKNFPGWFINAYPSFDPTTPLLSRIKQAPPKLLASASKEDQRDYTAYKLSPEELETFRISLGQLPKAFLKPLQDRLIGIYFITDLKTSGWTQLIIDKESLEDRHYIMMLHPKVLHMSLSEWLTDKENSAFLSDQNGLKVRVNAGDQVSGLTGILIHECAHIFDFVHHVTPYLGSLTYDIIQKKSPDQIKQYQKYGTPFLQSVWPNAQDALASEFKKLIEKRPIFYASEKEKLNLSEGLKLHQNMVNLPCPSLYSLIGWGEDYAEMAMFHHITKVLKQPYQIEFYEGEEIVFESEPMTHALVKSRLPIIESYHDYPISIPTPEKLPFYKIVGQYERVLPSNPYHHVSISLKNDLRFIWTNEANVSWRINVNKNSLKSGNDHHYRHDVNNGNIPADYLNYHMDWRQSESGEIRLCAIHHLGEWYVRL